MKIEISRTDAEVSIAIRCILRVQFPMHNAGFYVSLSTLLPSGGTADMAKDQQSSTQHVLGRFHPQRTLLAFRLNPHNQQRNKSSELNFKHLDAVFAGTALLRHSHLVPSYILRWYPKLNLPPCTGQHLQVETVVFPFESVC